VFPSETAILFCLIWCFEGALPIARQNKLQEAINFVLTGVLRCLAISILTYQAVILYLGYIQ
jgi:hypothetical protein